MNTIEKGQWEKSGLAEHAKNCHGQFSWNETKTLKIDANRFSRKVREAIEIQFHQTAPRNGGLNQDDGQYVTTPFWKPLLRHVSQLQCNGFLHKTN